MKSQLPAKQSKGLVSQEVEKLYLGNSQDNILTQSLATISTSKHRSKRSQIRCQDYFSYSINKRKRSTNHYLSNSSYSSYPKGITTIQLLWSYSMAISWSSLIIEIQGKSLGAQQSVNKGQELCLPNQLVISEIISVINKSPTQCMCNNYRAQVG